MTVSPSPRCVASTCTPSESWTRRQRELPTAWHRTERPSTTRETLQIRHPTSPRSGSPPAPQRWPARAYAQKHLARRSTRCGSPSQGCRARDDLRTSRPTRPPRGRGAPPKFHLLRYFGVLSGHSALRSEVVPEPEGDPLQRRPPPTTSDQLELLQSDDCRPSAPKR